MWPPVLSRTITRSPAIWNCCSKTLSKQHKVTFDRPTTEALLFRLQIQRVLDIDMKLVGVSRFFMRPIPKFHDEQQTRHRIQFFGRTAHLGMKMIGQLFRRQAIQNRRTEQAMTVGTRCWFEIHLGKKSERPSACPLSGHGGRDRHRGAVRPSGRDDTPPRPRALGGLSRKIPSRDESGNPSRSSRDS